MGSRGGDWRTGEECIFRRVAVTNKALLRLEAVMARCCLASSLRAGAKRDITLWVAATRIENKACMLNGC